MNRILFSPVGNTDPIKYCHDGSMLHICRHYKPAKVFLYMSKEIMEFQKEDERYTETLKLLGKSQGHEYEIHIIERPELTAVQQYDEFYLDFKNIIDEIKASMDGDDELLLNMASGTPAMKSALLILATLSEYRINPIQVSTPQKSSNLEHENRNDYDIEMFWECNEDNLEDAENRCTEVRCLNLVNLLKIDMIKKHLKSYDYHAALELAKEVKNSISDKAFALIEVANERLKLNFSKISQISQNYDYDLFPNKDGNGLKIIEYALLLQIKMEREEYADFIRGITPITLDLLVNILKKQCAIDIDNYTYSDSKNILKWDKKKLEGSEVLRILDNEFKPFAPGVVYSTHIARIITYKAKLNSVRDQIIKISEIESTLRNPAAHEIISITDEWFKKKVDCDAKEIMDIIRNLATAAGIRNDKDTWKSYQKMNETIIAML